MIIAVAHSKGGVGKSTISFNLAVTLSKSFDVELIDLDYQKTTTYSNALRVKHGLDAIPMITLENTKEYKEYVCADNDSKIAIVDVGGFDSELNRFVIVTSDIVITPVSASGRDLLGLKRFSSILEEMSNNAKTTIKTYVLLNNINPKKTKFSDLKQFILKSKHFEIFDTILKRRVDFDYSMDEGKSVIEYDNKSKASHEIKTLTKELKLIIKENR
ncbi:MAG TPA: ParA family protein [Sulfurospirillum arcachonense]|nr:ParA family protein [Sulfurospirillum arcachonense]